MLCQATAVRSLRDPIRICRIMLGNCANRAPRSAVLASSDARIGVCLGNQRNSMALPDSLVSLMSPHAYAHAVETVHLVETHISWILLTGEFAYKIKRPVTFPFVDLRSVERRAFLCKEEVRLNRRFAAEIYIGVCNITSDENGARFDGKGRVVEHAVKMVQFERREQLDALLAAQQIAPGELETFGDELAGIHSNLPSADPAHEWGRPVSVRETIVRNLDECTQASEVLAALICSQHCANRSRSGWIVPLTGCRSDVRPERSGSVMVTYTVATSSVCNRDCERSTVSNSTPPCAGSM